MEDDYIINPRTGRKVLKTGKIGKEILQSLEKLKISKDEEPIEDLLKELKISGSGIKKFTVTEEGPQIPVDRCEPGSGIKKFTVVEPQSTVVEKSVESQSTVVEKSDKKKSTVVEPQPTVVEKSVKKPSKKKSTVVEPQATVVEPQAAVVEPQATVVEPQSTVVEKSVKKPSKKKSTVVEPQAAVVEPQAVDEEEQEPITDGVDQTIYNILQKNVINGNFTKKRVNGDLTYFPTKTPFVAY